MRRHGASGHQLIQPTLLFYYDIDFAGFRWMDFDELDPFLGDPWETA
jgi:hypothetical protein